MAKTGLFDRTCVVHPAHVDYPYITRALGRANYEIGYSDRLDIGGDASCYYLKGKSDGMMHSDYMTWEEIRHFAAGMSRMYWYLTAAPQDAQ